MSCVTAHSKAGMRKPFAASTLLPMNSPLRAPQKRGQAGEVDLGRHCSLTTTA